MRSSLAKLPVLLGVGGLMFVVSTELAASNGLRRPLPPPRATAQALFSRAPAPENPDELELFGQFVGSWDFDFTSFIPGEEGSFEGEWHFAWILEGRGVQDVWIVPKRRRHPQESEYEYGSTVRVYNATIDAWQVSWHGPLRESFQSFIARNVGDEIVMTGGKAGTLPMRWIISDIQHTSFDWRAEVSVDEGETWIVVQTLHATRTR